MRAEAGRQYVRSLDQEYSAGKAFAPQVPERKPFLHQEYAQLQYRSHSFSL